MKPVELHIIMRNQTKEGLSEVSSDLNKVGQAVKQVTADFKTRMTEQRQVIKQVEADIKSLEKEYAKMAPGKEKFEFGKNLSRAKKVLEEEKGELIEIEKRMRLYEQAQRDAAKAAKEQEQAEKSKIKQQEKETKQLDRQKTYLYQMRQLRQEMFSLTNADGTVSPENMAKYDALKIKLGEVGSAYRRVVQEQRLLTTEGSAQLAGLVSGLSGVAGAFSAVQGASSLFVKDNEKLAEIQTRLQSVMAITIGLQQASVTLSATSTFRTQILTKIVNGWTAAQKFLNVQLGISNVLSRGLMATGIGLLIAGIGMLIYKVSTLGEVSKRDLASTANEIKRTGIAIDNIGKDVDFDVRIAEAAGKSKEELRKMRLEATKTALALADLSFDEVNAKYSAGKADASQVTEARDTAQKAWDNYMSVMNEITVADVQAKTDAKKRKIDSAKKQADEEKKLLADILHTQQERENLRISAIKDEGELVRKQIEIEYQRQIDEIKKQEEEWLKAQGKDGLTKKQEDWVQEKKGLADDKRTSDLTTQEGKEQRAQLESMREYLKEYGTFQQKKLAIAEEYAEKIKKAEAVGNVGEVKRLQSQRQSSMQNVELAAIKQNINWQNVFGNFGSMLKDQLQPTIDNLKSITKSPDFRKRSIEDQRTVFELISELENRNASLGGDMFKKVADDVTKLQRSLQLLDEAKKKEKDASDTLTQAKEREAEIEQNGGDTTAAKQVVATAKKAFDDAADVTETYTTEVQENSEGLSASSSNAINSLNGFASSLSGLTSGSLQGVGNALMGIDRLFNDSKVTEAVGKGVMNLLGENSKVSQTLSKAFENGGFIGQIIGAILSILDILKEGIGYIISSLIDTILNAVDGILENTLKGDFLVQIGKSLRDGIGNILNTISYGGWDSAMRHINGSNAKEVNEIIDRLTTSNKYLITAIEKLTAEMSKSGGLEATEFYESALEKQKQKIENDRQMLEAKMGYSNSHHSNNYYIGRDFSAEDWKKASDYVGKTLRSVGDLWELSPEDLAKLQELPDIWEKINGGKYNQSDWLDEYINDADTLLELTQQWQDAITDTSFDNIRNEMKSLLSDFKVDSKDALASVDEFMKNAILNSIVSGTYADLIKEWQELFADAMKDGVLTETEADFLRNRYQEIFDKAKTDRDAAFDVAGIKDTDEYSQSGRAGTFTTMSQDTGNELKGLFTSVQMHVSNIDDGVANIAQIMYQAMDAIGELIDNTSYCKYLEQMDERMERMERDGLKMQ